MPLLPLVDASLIEKGVDPRYNGEPVAVSVAAGGIQWGTCRSSPEFLLVVSRCRRYISLEKLTGSVMAVIRREEWGEDLLCDCGASSSLENSSPFNSCFFRRDDISGFAGVSSSFLRSFPEISFIFSAPSISYLTSTASSSCLRFSSASSSAFCWKYGWLSPEASAELFVSLLV